MVTRNESQTPNMPPGPPPGSLEAWAREQPLGTAVSDRRRSVDWATWNDRANRLANALEDELGLAAGDRVAVRLHNRLEWFEVGSALAKLGAAPVPVGTRLTADEVAYITSHSGARLFVTDDPETARAASSFRDHSLRAIILVGGDAPDGVLDFEEPIHTAAEALREAGVPDRQAAAHARAIDETVEHLVTQEYLDSRLAELRVDIYRLALIQAGVIIGAVVALLRLLP